MQSVPIRVIVPLRFSIWHAFLRNERKFLMHSVPIRVIVPLTTLNLARFSAE